VWWQGPSTFFFVRLGGARVYDWETQIELQMRYARREGSAFCTFFVTLYEGMELIFAWVVVVSCGRGARRWEASVADDSRLESLKFLRLFSNVLRHCTPADVATQQEAQLYYCNCGWPTEVHIQYQSTPWAFSTSGPKQSLECGC
jgi:hypothetical protein